MRTLAAVAIWFLCSVTGVAQAPVELEETMFVLKPGTAGIRGVVLAWIPQPIEKFCLGKTHTECSSMDYCIRTTSKDVPMCRNLAVKLSSLPHYPADMRPRRMISITLLSPATTPGFAELLKFVEDAPAGTLDRLSLKARVKARIKFTRKPDDDDFQVLEILTQPSP